MAGNSQIAAIADSYHFKALYSSIDLTCGNLHIYQFGSSSCVSCIYHDILVLHLRNLKLSLVYLEFSTCYRRFRQRLHFVVRDGFRYG